MPTNRDDEFVCLPRSTISHTYCMLVEKTYRAPTFNELVTTLGEILGQVFFLMSILRDSPGIG